MDVIKNRMIYGIVGGVNEFDIALRGNGKTCTMTYYLMKEHFYSKRIVYSNYQTTFSAFLTPEEIKNKILTENLENIAVGIDEMQLFLNSLGEKKKVIEELIHLLLAQTRKRNVNVYWTTQRYRDVHIRLRTQTDLIIIPEKVHVDGVLCARDNCEKSHLIYVYSVELPYPDRTLLEIFPPETIGKYYNQFEIIKK